MNLHFIIIIIIVLLISILISPISSEALATPFYEYLKNLCPVGQLPLTSSKTVKTCAGLCPLGALCYKGICCVPPPQCRHPAYRTSTGFPCLRNVKNNCPENSQCVSSSQDGMSICCSSKTVDRSFPITRSKSIKPKISMKKEKSSLQKSVSSLLPDLAEICPKSHPIIAHDGQSLVLCKHCVQGVCAKFRSSNVEVCCQNSDDICGVGSQVLIDSMVPRDCNKKPCGTGYECSLTPTGHRVCCSLAKCPSGVFARSVCAAGCLRTEKCTSIQNEMWCCPATESEVSRLDFLCNDGGKPTGEKCDPAFPACSQGALCEINKDETAHICCKRFRSRLANRKSIITPPFLYTTTTTPKTTTTTQEPFPVDVVPNCQDPDTRPLMDNGLPYMCVRPGDACLRAGYTCQESDIDDVYVCCTIPLNRLFPPQIPMIPATTTTTTTEEPEEEEEEKVKQPTCPFSYMPSKTDHNEVQRCLTLFSLDCPFGYTCLPSSTTDSYLCCIRKPVI